MTKLSAEQHLKSIKNKANDLVANGDFYGAVQLFNHELGQHNETKFLANAVSYSQGREASASGDPRRVRDWIDSHTLGSEENRS